MAWIGLLTATNPCLDAPDRARSWLCVAGETLLERNLHMLSVAGATRLLLYVGTTTPHDDVKLAQLRRRYPALDICFNGPELAASLHGPEQIVLIEEGILIDPAILDLVLAGDAPHTLAVWPAESVYGRAGVRLDTHFSFASVVCTQVETVRQVSRGLGDWDLTQTLVRTALGSGSAKLIDLSAPMRKEAGLEDGVLAPKSYKEPPATLWLPLHTRADEADATARLIAFCQQQSPRASWPERFAYPSLLKGLSPLWALNMLAHPWRAAALLALYTTGMLLGAALGWKWQALLFLMCLPLFVRALHLSLLLFNRVPNQLARYQPWFEQAVFILWLACFAMGSPDVIAISLGLLIVCPFVSYWVLHAGLDRAPLKVLRMPQAMDKIAYAIQPTLTTLPLILLPFALMGLWSWGIWALAAQCLASWGLFAARLYVWLGTHQSQQR